MSEKRLGDWDEKEVVLISALEHYCYCPRQCALIHIEQTFDENVHTMRGHAVHKRVHEEEDTVEQGVRVERALPLWSERLGIIGKADVVEFHGDIPYPVEYKHGPKRKHQNDDVQLCAQALCLEEMTGYPVKKGAIFHYSSRRRREVGIDSALRRKTEEIIIKVRDMLVNGILPPPVNDERCRECSLADSCFYEILGEKGKLRRLEGELFSVEKE